MEYVADLLDLGGGTHEHGRANAANSHEVIVRLPANTEGAGITAFIRSVADDQLPLDIDMFRLSPYMFAALRPKITPVSTSAGLPCFR